MHEWEGAMGKNDWEAQMEGTIVLTCLLHWEDMLEKGTKLEISLVLFTSSTKDSLNYCHVVVLYFQLIEIVSKCL
jgi:hypothetical protein